ncbi:MAG: hypothetical protein ABIG70_03080 [Pseudomonadota bacterium]
MIQPLCNCADCFWASLGTTYRADGPLNGFPEWMCNAPEVVAVLLLGNDCISVRHAREFSAMCGDTARFFVQRRPGNKYINACLRDDNYDELPDELRGKAGQRSDAQEPQ